MNMIDVISSNIAQIGYDPDKNTLVIAFKNGRQYEYPGVPQTEFNNLLGADSKGSYAAANIYKIYSPRRII